MFAGGPKNYSYDPKEKTRQVSHECALEHYDRTRLLWFVDYLYLHYVVKTVRSGYHVIVARKCHFGLVYYYAPDNGAKYCDDCVCLSVSISLELQFTSSPILVLVTCGRGSVLLCCYCDTLCTSEFAYWVLLSSFQLLYAHVHMSTNIMHIYCVVLNVHRVMFAYKTTHKRRTLKVTR